MLGKETAETNLRTLRLPCYLQLLGVDVGERDCGDESADGAVTMPQGFQRLFKKRSLYQRRFIA